LIGGHYFKRIRRHRVSHASDIQPDADSLIALLSHQVIERYARISDVKAIAIPLVLRGPTEAEDPPSNPGHPACADYADSDYCRESWQLHLAELKIRPETHWHTCDHGKRCAYAPVLYRDRCLAVVRLACSASMTEEEFEHHAELLDTLVRDFVFWQADFLERLLRAERAATEFGGPPAESTAEPHDRRPSHPQVLRALEYIDEHLSDQKLTIARIAGELDVHPYYLSHLFAEQVGQRMSRFIAARRVELAKSLLATTHWQIKRIAHETGHANPNWFSHVFSAHTGLTPLGYRRKARAQARDPSSARENAGS
jgi:AraC-like DNA-binding protein